jgi:hypothetical protein
MSDAWPHYKLSPTRYRLAAQYQYGKFGDKISDECNIYYGKQPGVGWRFVVENDGYAEVGLIYKTKDELLADLPRYAAQWSKEWQE